MLVKFYKQRGGQCIHEMAVDIAPKKGQEVTILGPISNRHYRILERNHVYAPQGDQECQYHRAYIEMIVERI